MRWGRFGLIKQPRNASSSRAVGVAKEGRCGVPDPHSHSCWACDAFETPADILVWTRACKMLLCDCACRICFECGHLRNAAASMAHAQRASMGMSAVPQAVWSTRRCIECEWRWSGVCMAVYQEHFHPVPRSTAAEPSRCAFELGSTHEWRSRTGNSCHEGFKLATVAPSDSIRPVPKCLKKRPSGRNTVCSLPQFAGEGKKIGRQGTMSASQRRQAGAGASECMCAAASVRGTCGHRYI